MAYAAFWFSAMSLFVKIAGVRLPSMEIVLVRGVITLLLSWALVRRAGLHPLGNRRGMLLLRGALGAAALICFYFSIVHLPLAEATVIQYMNPVFAALLAAVLIRERLGVREIVAIVASLIGVALIARPSFLFADAPAVNPVHIAIALGGAVFSGTAYVTVRMLRGADDALVIVLYFPLVTVPVALPFAVAQWVPPTPFEWLVMLGIGITTQIAQVYMTRGLQLEPTGRATAIGYLQIVFAAMWGALLLGERIDAWSALGAIVIVAGTLLISFRRRPARPSPAPTTSSPASLDAGV